MIKKLKEQKLLFDIVNVVLGIILIVMLVLTFIDQSKNFLIVAFYAGGLMNLFNGIKMLLNEKKKTGNYLLLLAALIFFSATLLLF